MTYTLVVAVALLASGFQEPAESSPATARKSAESPARDDATEAATAAALAEYEVLRAKTPNTADAHWKLGLWCEQKGLKAEAQVDFTAVTRLDPNREPAWKKLGFEKHNGRWTTPERLAAERAEADAQRKADAHWHPLLQKWKSWLEQKTKQSEAEEALAKVHDPRAVPSIWRVFATGSATDQERAVDILGHIEGERPTRALAGLAIYGKTPLVRRAAAETLARRKWDDAVLIWINLLRDPTKYEVRQVAGPGLPGVLLVDGQRFNVRRFYAPPTLSETQALFIDDSSMRRPLMPLQLNSTPPGPPPGARQVGASNNTDFYVYDYTWAPPPMPKTKTAPDPSPAYQTFELFQFQARFNRDFELTETEKMAAGAQAQLEHDVGAIEAANATIRETNARLAEALGRVTGNEFGEKREAWLKWWMERRGYSYVPPQDRPKATVDVRVPLPYVPQSGPPVVTPGGGGGGGGGRGWCMLWDHEKGQRPHTGHCFAAGTLVLTPDGPRAIETLRVGDRVLTCAGPDRTVHAAPIVSLHHSEAPSTLRLALKGEGIVTTEGHPIWKAGSGWARAADLEPGDDVLTMSGRVQVEATETREPQSVWNLRVGEGSCFFVGRLGMLVHDISPIVSGHDAWGQIP